MSSSAHPVGTPAITENLLKHKWSLVILRHIRNGIHDPSEILRLEGYIAPSAVSERLRTMLRYNLVTRHSQSSRPKVVTYRIVPKGRRMLTLLEMIQQLDHLPDSDPRLLEEIFRTDFQLRSAAPLIVAETPPESPAAPAKFPTKQPKALIA